MSAVPWDAAGQAITIAANVAATNREPRPARTGRKRKSMSAKGLLRCWKMGEIAGTVGETLSAR